MSSDILRIIHSILDLNSFDDHTFWAACLLAYFGFLRSAEFTVPILSAFDPGHHLSVRDIAVDVPLNPSCLQICITASKSDPFRKGCKTLICPGSPSFCAVQPVVSFLECRGDRPRPLFLFKNGLPSSRSLLTDRLRAILLNAGLAWRFFKSQFPKWGSHFYCKGWYSRSPYPSFRPLEKQCLHTTYSNSSRPHNSRSQIYGGLVWWVYFYLVLLTAFFWPLLAFW